LPPHPPILGGFYYLIWSNRVARMTTLILSNDTPGLMRSKKRRRKGDKRPLLC